MPTSYEINFAGIAVTAAFHKRNPRDQSPQDSLFSGQGRNFFGGQKLPVGRFPELFAADETGAGGNGYVGVETD